MADTATTTSLPGSFFPSTPSPSSSTNRRNPTTQPIPTPTSNPSTSTDSEERTCRICFEGESIESGRLISPCSCKGTARYIHSSCLNQWRQSSANSTNFYKCAQCQYSYKLSRTAISALITHPMTLLIATGLMLLLLVFLSGFIASFIIELVEDRQNSSYGGGGFFSYGYGFGDHLLIGDSIKTASLLMEDSIFKDQEGFYNQSIWRRALVHCFKGISLVGVASFLQLSVSTLFFSSWGLRSTLFRMFNPRRRNGNERGGLGVSEVVLIGFILFGVWKAVQRLYGIVQLIAKKILSKLDILVADV